MSPPASGRVRMDRRIILLGFGLGEVVRRLEIEPEARIGLEIAAEPYRRIGRNVPPLPQQAADPVTGHAEFPGKPTRAQAERQQVFLAQDSPGWVRMRDMASASSVVAR